AFTWTPDDGPATTTVKVRVSDGSGLFTQETLTVTVTNAAPTASGFGAPAVAVAGVPVAFTFANPTDPSGADRAAGLRYSYDLNNDGTFEISNSPNPTASFPFAQPG